MAVLKKNAKGYGYKYTDIAEINASLEEMGIEYYQYVQTEEGADYIYTVPIIDGKEQAPRRGCKIVIPPFDKKSNPAQEQGSGITYARRYSLLMAFGLATTDDDAQCMTREKEEGMAPGYPSRDEAIKIIKKRYPEGSDLYTKLLKAMDNASSVDEMTDAQLISILNKLNQGKKNGSDR